MAVCRFMNKAQLSSSPARRSRASASIAVLVAPARTVEARVSASITAARAPRGSCQCPRFLSCSRVWPHAVLRIKTSYHPQGPRRRGDLCANPSPQQVQRMEGAQEVHVMPTVQAPEPRWPLHCGALTLGVVLDTRTHCDVEERRDCD